MSITSGQTHSLSRSTGASSTPRRSSTPPPAFGATLFTLRSITVGPMGPLARSQRGRPTDQHTHSFLMAHGLRLRPSDLDRPQAVQRCMARRARQLGPRWNGRAAEPSLLARSSPLLSCPLWRRWPPLTWPDGRTDDRRPQLHSLSLPLLCRRLVCVCGGGVAPLPCFERTLSPVREERG